MKASDSTRAGVTIITGDFVPTGGMDMPNLALASYLARRGTPVDLVAHRADAAVLGLPSVRFHRVLKPLGSYFLGSPLLTRVGQRVGERTLEAGGRVVVNGGNCPIPDVSWVHYVHAAYEPSAGQGLRLFKNALARRVALASERRVLREARLVIANSARTRADLVERLGVAEDRVRIVYYGVDARFRPADTEERQGLRRALGLGAEPTLAFVGGLGDRRKGFDTLFDAWRRLGSSWDARLLVLGRGAELETWRARVRDAGLDARVRFLGFRSDTPQILKSVDAIVAPTRYEAFGQAVQEALCCGAPAIVSAAAGVAERIDDEPELRSLLLSDPESSVELGSRLEHWRNRVPLLRERALALSARLCERNWDTMAAEISELLS